MDWSNDNCPVCRGSAREALPRMGDFAEIICDSCGRYRISGTAIEVMRHDDDDARRTRILEQAKLDANDGAIPFVQSYMT